MPERNSVELTDVFHIKAGQKVVSWWIYLEVESEKLKIGKLGMVHSEKNENNFLLSKFSLAEVQSPGLFLIRHNFIIFPVMESELGDWNA